MKEKVLSLPKSFWMDSLFFIALLLGVGAFLQKSFEGLISYRELAIAGAVMGIFLILFEVYKD